MSDLYTLDAIDRRRLAEAEVLYTLEQNGSVSPLAFGEAILHQATNEDEVLALGDAVMACLNARFARGGE